MQYHKKPISIKDQIERLRSRGLAIADESLAERSLRNISYYRLAGYWWPMQADKVKHIFKSNSCFDDVIALYMFDSELRILVFNAIERIEIGLRTRMINHLTQEVDPWWFENCTIFKDPKAFNTNLTSIDRELRNSKEIFITEHFNKYHTDNRRPPAWKTLEVASFGVLSRLYGNLSGSVKSRDTIAAQFNTVNHTYLRTWLQAITQIRNICAHHGRLWNKNLAGRPKLLPNPPAQWIQAVPAANEHHMLYIHLCCIKYILDAINPGHRMAIKLRQLFVKYPSVDVCALGFPQNWMDEIFWNS